MTAAVDEMALAEELLSLCDRRSDAEHRIVELGVVTVARAALGEIVERATAIRADPLPGVVGFDLDLRGQRASHVVSYDGKDWLVEQGSTDRAWVRLRQDLPELLATLYGPTGSSRDATREVHTRDESAPNFASAETAEQRNRRGAIELAQHLLATCSESSPGLMEMSVQYGSDKWGGHWYTPHYERHFAAYREQRVQVLELGVGGYDVPDRGGASLRMWRQFFRRGLVYGLDVFVKSGLDRPRMRTVRGDQSDGEFLASLAARLGPLDIVIDDGSHLSADVLTSFAALWPALVPGGMYVIEDLQTSYWPGWNGGRGVGDDAGTSVGLLKELVDGLHHADQECPGTDRDRTVVGVHAYHNIAFIEKGINTEQTLPAWVSRTEHPSDWAKGLADSEGER